MAFRSELAETPAPRTSPEALAFGALVALVVAFAAWRSTLGASLYDDAHYTLMTLRLAQGVKPIADEFTLQAFGFLVPAVAAKVWLTLAGVQYLALVLRLFYVALASAAWYVGYRALKPTFGALPSALGMAAPLLAAPYGILMASYNTMSEIGFMLAAALGYAALRDASRSYAAAAGFALALGVISYPPMALPAVALAVCFALLCLAEKRTLLASAALGAVVPLAALALWVFAFTTPAQVQTALAYSRAAQGQVGSLLRRIQLLGGMLPQTLFAWGVWPLWALAAVACLRGRWQRFAGFAAALMPAAALVPGLAWPSTHGEAHVFGATPPAYLLYLTVVAAIPVTVHAWRGGGDAEMKRFLQLVGPSAIVGVPLVAYSTSSGWNRGLSEIGAAALSVAVVAGLARIARGAGDRLGPLLLVAALLGCQIWLLSSFTFDDGSPFRVPARVSGGALGGLSTLAKHETQFADATAVGRKLIGPHDRVLVVGAPGLYLLLPGVAYTNATWLVAGPADAATIRYYESTGATPDHVFIVTNRVVRGRLRHDPLIEWVDSHYQQARGIYGFIYYRRK